MKNIILLVLISVSCFAQQESRQFGIIEVFRGGDSLFIKKLTTQVINISDGTVTKMRTPPDTAKLFLASDGGIYEGVITWKKVGSPIDPPDPVMTTSNIDNVNAANTYVGTWNHPSNIEGHFNNTISWNCTPGATVTTEFNGSEITWYAELKSTHGKVGISVDGGAEVIIDQYSADFVKRQPLWNVKGLSDGPHTVRLRVTGQKNPSATDVCLVHDYFEVKKMQ